MSTSIEEKTEWYEKLNETIHDASLGDTESLLFLRKFISKVSQAAPNILVCMVARSMVDILKAGDLLQFASGDAEVKDDSYKMN